MILVLETKLFVFLMFAAEMRSVVICSPSTVGMYITIYKVHVYLDI